MKRQKFTASMIILLLMVLSIPLAASSAPDDTIPLSPTDDYTMNSGNSVVGNGTSLGVVGQVVTVCAATQESFLKFNLTSVTTPITDAQLRLRSNFATGGSNTLTMGIFTSSNEGWTEGGGFTWAARPTPVEGTALATANKTAAPGDVVFSGGQLAAALEAQRTSGADPKLVTLVITAIGCTGASTAQAMDSRTGTTPPVLTLTTQPTAVTLSTFHASDPAANWPLVAGLGALAAVVIGGLAVTRRRAAGR